MNCIVWIEMRYPAVYCSKNTFLQKMLGKFKTQNDQSLHSSYPRKRGLYDEGE